MKRVIGKRPNQIPEDIVNNDLLAAKIQQLPQNYNFEFHKTLARIREVHAKRIGIQFPEGLQFYACLISDILMEFGELEECIILADAVYGACCIDDITSDELGLDLLIHYGHSCLIPINETCIKTLYVFVDIFIDVPHLVYTLEQYFPDKQTPIALVGTIQFVQAISQAGHIMKENGYSQLIIPQSKPRTGGEVLGCTSPKILQQNIVSVSDGRFHLEAVMIQNPDACFFRYDPYTKNIYDEFYDLAGMKERRFQIIQQARNSKHVGIIMGTLGRQGSPYILKQLCTLLDGAGVLHSQFLFSEITEQGMLKYPEIDAWIEIACPRLAIDWGHEFQVVMLNPYEAYVAWKDAELDYPMDNYAYGGGTWSVYTAKSVQ